MTVPRFRLSASRQKKLQLDFGFCKKENGTTEQRKMNEYQAMLEDTHDFY